MPSVSIKSALRQRITHVTEGFGEALKEELEAPAKKLTTKYRRVVGQWEHKPVFAYRITVRSQQVKLTVYPRGEGRQQFLWVDRGTAPYTIRPKNGGFLRFQTGYSARTGTGARYNVGTGTASGSWVSAKQVNHPGIAARKFSEKFSKEVLPDMRRIINNAFKKAARGQS